MHGAEEVLAHLLKQVIALVQHEVGEHALLVHGRVEMATQPAHARVQALVYGRIVVLLRRLETSEREKRSHV